MCNTVHLPELDPDFDPVRAAHAGMLAAFAYLGVMYADMAVSGSRSDDLLMLGRPFTTDPRRAKLLGLSAHTAFGAFMGLLFGGLVRRRLWGPSWARGITMMLCENTVLWPLTFVADRFHPSMRGGELPRLNTPVPFIQQVVRHVGFGVVMGWLYGRGRTRDT